MRKQKMKKHLMTRMLQINKQDLKKEARASFHMPDDYFFRPALISLFI
jgi:hypothetical protein